MKTPKTQTMRPAVKKKKQTDVKIKNEDSISETISFVIKGKLTPIKTELSPISNTSLDKKLLKKKTATKIIKKKAVVQKPKLNKLKKVLREKGGKLDKLCKIKTKVQIKTAKKSALKPGNKRIPEPISSQITSSLSNIALTPHLTTCTQKKVVSQKKTPAKQDNKNKDTKDIKNAKDPKETKSKEIKEVVIKPKRVVKPITSGNNVDMKKKQTKTDSPIRTYKKKPAPPKEPIKIKEEDPIEDIETKETIEKLLEQANKALKQPPSDRLKVKKINKDKPKKSSDKIIKKLKKPLKTTTCLQKEEDTDKSDNESLMVIKEEIEEKPDKKKIKQKVLVKESNVKSKNCDSSSKAKKKINPVKKRKIKKEDDSSNSRDSSPEVVSRKHREASLNALAKVHCLYENETRGNMLDSLELEYLKRGPFNIKKELLEREKKNDELEVSTRTLRSAPGLRAVGKHWDMADTTSSSEDNSGYETDVKLYKPKIKKEVVPVEEKEEKPKEVKKIARKRRRNQNELFMDLKDMVVRKRMASLNASAILAASYSTDRRSMNSPTSENSYGDTDSESEECISTDEEILKKKCFEDDVKKEEKLIEVHTTPNKKVAVILNQDTDVTITGVYVNSTTRSTHHEGYCSIAGMQYRISATSHTQTAATAVATETLLQSSSTSAPENSNSESLPSSKSYTPLDALSNMQPPPGPGIQHNHPHAVIHAPPPHVLPIPPAHQVSPTVRHGCPSAFTSPHASGTSGYPPHPSAIAHHEDPAYLHGYYQPAGPLITVPHAHGQPAAQQPQPQAPPPLTKSAPLSEASPTSTSPPPPTHLPPPPPSSNGDSSDSEVIITSVTTAKEAMPQHPQTTYRFTQYPSTPPGYAYSYPPYPYPTPPPPSPYPHHDLCYPPNPYIHHKYPPPATYRRYLPSSSYYPPNPQDVYPPPPAGSSAQPTQQVVTATPVSASGTGFQTVPSGAAPTIIETYSGPPPPTLVETYQPAPHYYPTPYGPPPPPPSCYTHSPSRTIPYINATYQSCPCPMQSCPKNVLTGPLTGDSKRSNISSIAKDSMPLPPVRLALPLEPASATGPPSPARGSAGMPPPPSPAGATYQTPPVPKEESHATEPTEESKNGEKKRKARIGKAMVRNDIMRQSSTMLLMCNPQVNGVKREIESPQDKIEVVEEKKEICHEPETKLTEVSEPLNDINDNQRICTDLKEEKESEEEQTEKEVNPEVLQPCVSTVAENVKVKNMKRKVSMSSENVPEAKKPKPEYLGSYKNLIKRDTSNIKINNGKRKLLSARVCKKPLRPRLKVKNQNMKRVIKSKYKNMTPKQVLKAEAVVDSTSVVSEKDNKKKQKKTQVNSKTNSKSESTLSNNVSNHYKESIESVVSEIARTVKKSSVINANSKVSKTNKEPVQNKKSTNLKKNKISQLKPEDQKDQVKVEKTKVKKENTKTQAITKNNKKSKVKEVVKDIAPRIYRRSSHPKWSNGWKWEGEPYEAKVFINSDETIVTRICYPAMRHTSGDLIEPRDCVLLKAGPRKNDLPFVAKIAALWENPEDGEMMMSLLWYYRPEHTEQGRLPTDCPDEVFASRHKDSNSVACIDDKCYVLTFNEYCRYRKNFKRLEEGLNEPTSCIPSLESYPRVNRQPPDPLRISPEMVFFCRRVYDFRQKRIIKNPT